MALDKTVFQDISQNIEARVESLLRQMTLAEKIGQMTQVEKNSIQPEDVKNYAIGSVLSGGGGSPTPNTPKTWVEMVTGFAKAALETRLGIPMIYGSDAVHGHSNVVDAVIFPHNIGLGATRDPELVERIGRITARECLATGVHWDFAPALSVPQDIRWGRIYEGYSENTELVTELAVAYICGLQSAELDGMWVLPSIKHFVGDGGTVWGTTKPQAWLPGSNWQAATGRYRIDQGDTQLDEETLRRVHLAPYVEAIKAGALNVMVSFSSWNGEKMHGNKYLISDVLKGELGFEGFVVTDWSAIDQLEEDFYNCVVRSINAGIDMVMVPYDYKRFIATLTEAVHKGDVSQARIDDAVRRILSVKLKLGVFEKPLADEKWLKLVGSEEHREVAREAVRKSLVLLKNEKGTLPLDKGQGILVAGEAANNIALACGGWSIHWQGGHGAITTGKTLLDGITEITDGIIDYQKQADFEHRAPLAVVVVAEAPYAEGLGDQADPSLTEVQKALIKKTREHCEKLLLVIYSGRPLVIEDVVDDCDAIVAAWLPGTEANAIADVLYGDVPFTGKLSYNWPRSMEQIPLSALKTSKESAAWEFGYGLTI